MEAVRTLSQTSLRLARPLQIRTGQFERRTYTVTKQLRQDGQDYEHFYKYTSGRWLWGEDAQLQKHYKKFNVPALKHIAARSVGAQACVSMAKVAEAASGKVFKLSMDNGATVIAKIPVPYTGPTFRSTASEVATTDFASTVLDIHTPKVLTWSATAENAVATEYIIFEEARGTSLYNLWVGMDFEERLQIVHEVIEVEKKMISISLNKYGSVYFSEDAFEGCEPAQVQGSVSAAKQADVQKRFVMGPTSERSFYHGERLSMGIDRGPWHTSTDSLKAIAHREMAWIKQHAQPKHRPDFPFGRPEVQHCQQAHIDLYEKFLAVADHLIPHDEAMRKSTLWHWNMISNNIFVENGRITALTDWWGVHAAPLFQQARVPGIFRRVTEETPQLPDDYEEMEDEDDRRLARRGVTNTMRQWSYEHAR